MDYSQYTTLKTDITGGVATVRMDRPEKLNAVNAVMHEELARIFVDLHLDEDVDIVILTGNGKAFSAGGDIPWMQTMIDDPARFEKTAKEAKQIIFSLLDCEKPVIARVNGYATGLGATIALFCDIIFMAESAKIGDPHVCVGFVAGDGGAVIWPQLIGYARAKEYLMTGKLMPAADAERMGLINHAVADDGLDAAIQDFIGQLRKGSPQAVRWTKTSVNIGLKQLAQSILDASLAYEGLSNMTADHQEAVSAFLEGRPPVFSGK